MKKFMLAFALLIGVTSFYNNTVSAQTINISINVGRQPAWGPVGYDYAGFYYFPEINSYYDVNMGTFYYVDRGHWVSARYLPYAYRNYDLYRLYKVVLNVRNPWRYNHTHYRDYSRYCGYNHRQVIIRDSRDYRYHDSRRNNVRWYSSDRYSVNRYDNRYTYNDNRNSNSRHSEYNNNRNSNNNNNNRYSNSQSNRPSYNSQQKDNSRSNSDRYQTENKSKENRDYNSNSRNSNTTKRETRPSVSNRENNRPSRTENVERSTRRNDNSSSSNRSSDFRLASNERSGRGR